MFVPILAYHKIQARFPIDVSNTTPAQFEQQIHWLHAEGYRTISFLDYVDGKYSGQREVLITFDDTYASVYENAFPILAKYHFTATVFVIAKYVGRWNSWDHNFPVSPAAHCGWNEIRFLLARGWEVGSHTVGHPNLRRLTRRQIWYELRYSKTLIEHKLGTVVNVVSYPFGRFDCQVVELVRDAGYLAGCTLGYQHPDVDQFPHALARRGVYFFEPFVLYKAKLRNNYLSHCDDLKQRLFSRAAQSSLLGHFPRSASKLLD